MLDIADMILCDTTTETNYIYGINFKKKSHESISLVMHATEVFELLQHTKDNEIRGHMLLLLIRLLVSLYISGKTWTSSEFRIAIRRAPTVRIAQ